MTKHAVEDEGVLRAGAADQSRVVVKQECSEATRRRSRRASARAAPLLRQPGQDNVILVVACSARRDAGASGQAGLIRFRKEVPKGRRHADRCCACEQRPDRGDGAIASEDQVGTRCARRAGHLKSARARVLPARDPMRVASLTCASTGGGVAGARQQASRHAVRKTGNAPRTSQMSTSGAAASKAAASCATAAGTRRRGKAARRSSMTAGQIASCASSSRARAEQVIAKHPRRRAESALAARCAAPRGKCRAGRGVGRHDVVVTAGGLISN